MNFGLWLRKHGMVTLPCDPLPQAVSPGDAIADPRPPHQARLALSLMPISIGVPDKSWTRGHSVVETQTITHWLSSIHSCNEPDVR